MTSLLRRLWRFARLAVHLSLGLFEAAFRFGRYSLAERDRAISRWSASLLDILGVRLAAGTPPPFTQGALLVANHVSWLDVFAIHAARRVHFVSKREVRDWPLVGWLAWRAGTLFIERAKKTDTARINQEMHALLKDGAWVAVFPEGTSTDGRRLLRFLPPLFQPAVDENLPVVPVALQYETPDGAYTDAAVYADNLSFGRSLWRIAGEKAIIVRLVFCEPLQGGSRRELAEAAWHRIAKSLGFESTDTPPGTRGGPPA